MCDSSGINAIRDETLPRAADLGVLLRSRRLTVATAESCTGGGIAFAVTSIAGASDYFEGSVVAYSNGVKERVLGVSPDTLTNAGAVSERCAREMAAGVRRAISADVGVSSTGIAGPGGATARKPVGLVYIAVATPEGTVARELRLDGDRATVMRNATLAAISLACETVGALAP